MKLIQSIPYPALIVFALLMALAPFRPAPHFVEKWRMLFSGTLHRPLDWFDLVLHTFPLALLLVRIVYDLQRATR